MEMQRVIKYYLVGVLAAMAILPILSHARCNYPAIFNFGDSTSDTGAIHFAFPYNELSENLPYGQTFFGKPTGRYSDGRLSIDFFAKALGLPFLSPYLQSVAPNFGQGANFAAAGATARDTDSFIAPISLTVQINEFKVFKQQVLASIKAHGSVSYLPSAEAFNSGIYTIEIGGNDFSYAYMTLNLNTTQVKETILPKIARSIEGAVQAVYNEGARTILVRDVAPQGCGPFWLTYFSHSSNDFGKHGCSISYNDAVLHYNTLLRAQLSSLRKQLKDANIIYVNTYDIIYDFFANPSKYGFKATTDACCGIGGKYNYRYSIQCGTSGIINGRNVTAVTCSDPSSYISWDGVHWTDEANRLLTQHILTGNYFEPSFSLASFCDLQSL
jgi:phospholipase/lecithinase/hemolysin